MVVSTQFFHLIVFQERVQLMCNHTKNDAIWGLIVLFLTNQIAGNTIHFKINVKNFVIKGELQSQSKLVLNLRSYVY